MDSFLSASKQYLDNIMHYSTVRVVIGNTACDLDSAICALVYAFHHYTEAKKKNQDIAVIPLLDIPETEFRLKTEVVYYLKKHNITAELLSFKNQVDLEALNNEKKLEIVLVDHHTLSEDNKSLANSVIEIIDHRPQDPKWLWPEKILLLEIVGSCATLIGRILLEKKSKTLDHFTCSLLRGPILVDTANFSKKANKATPADVEVIERLEKLGSITYDREKEYKEILTAKTNIDSLTPDDLLRKDLKLANGIPISGLPILVEKFIKIDSCFEDLSKFTKQHRFPVTIVMGLSLTDDMVTRDIAIFSLRSNKLQSKIIEALNAHTNPPLKLTKVATSFDHNEHNFTLFKIGNIEASRKQILPIINGISIDCLC